MTDEDITGFNDRVTEKLGKENAAIIADEMGILITKNTEAQKHAESLQQENARLKETNEKLAAANANLIHQIPMSDEPAPTNRNRQQVEEDQPKSVNWDEIFDKKGNFIE